METIGALNDTEGSTTIMVVVLGLLLQKEDTCCPSIETEDEILYPKNDWSTVTWQLSSYAHCSTRPAGAGLRHGSERGPSNCSCK